jgi:hypothetical protein
MHLKFEGEVDKEPLSLREAQVTGRLSEFIAEQEATHGVGVGRAKFDRLVKAAVKSPQAKGQTSRSASRGDSSGK